MLQNQHPTTEEVIEKLKDDGDFDVLRLKIIRKIKENEELRSSIISTIKQTDALNHPGSEKLKPRQLSDAIHEEIGSKVMSEISDALWGVIRSNDDMQNEIKETVKSVYNKLINPPKQEEMESFNSKRELKNHVILNSEKNVPHNTEEPEPSVPPGFSSLDLQQDKGSEEPEPDIPPGFSPLDCQQQNNAQPKNHNLIQSQVPSDNSLVLANAMQPKDGDRDISLPRFTDLTSPKPTTKAILDDPDDNSGPPGFVPAVVQQSPGPNGVTMDDNDDPDVPPGFG